MTTDPMTPRPAPQAWPPGECEQIVGEWLRGPHAGSFDHLAAMAMAAALEGAASNVEQRVERCRAAENFAPAVFLGEVEDWLRSRAAAYARPEAEQQLKESP